MLGKLYVVGTPIGNLADITERAIETLRIVDFIVAENRNHSLKLLNHFGIKKQIISINSYNEERKTEEIIKVLKKGKQCALITSAGTPCISDPGAILVRACHDVGIDVKVVPGPSAVVGALSASGLFVDKFLFYGFLPQKKGKKVKILKELFNLPYPIVFFESPRRLLETLYCIKEVCEKRLVVIVKEMTKIYEDIIRGNISEMIERLQHEEIRGEYVIIVNGKEI